MNIANEQAPTPVPTASSDRHRDEKLLRHFGFREAPFGVTPNPAFLFSSGMHRAALQSMIQSIESNLGFTVLLGGPGMGKTTLLLHLLTQYRDSARTAFIFQTQCKRYDLLRFLASELELPEQHDEVGLHQRLKEMLVNEARAGRKVLIFIDEAQNLRHPSLEAIRLLSDFETARNKLLHIILAGSAQLGETLRAPELSPLAQRIATVCRLEALTPQEVNGYVTFRLGVAGCRAAEHLFSPEALAEVAEQSAGIPRVINSICYRALVRTYAGGERRVSVKMVHQAASDLDLAHPSGAVNSTSVPLQRPEYRPGPNADLFFEEEKHEALNPEAPSPELRGAFEEPGVRSPPTAKFAVAEPVDQPPFPQPQAGGNPETLPEFRPEKRYSFEAAETNRYSDSLTTPGLKPGKGHTRFTLHVASALTLLAAGLGVGWYELQVRSGTAGHESDTVKPIAGPTGAQDENPGQSDSAQIYSPNTSAESNANPADRRRINRSKTQAPIVETFSQNLVPPKLSQQRENPVKEPSPAAINITKIPDSLTVPVATMPKPLAAPPEPSRQAAIAEVEDSTTANQSAEYQTAPRQPIKIVKPIYPERAEARHIEGDVVLELQVDSGGKVQTVRTLSGDSLLGEAAEKAARQWQFPRAENQAASTVTRVKFNFKLPTETNR